MSRFKFRAFNGSTMEYGGFCVHSTHGFIVTESPLTRVKDDSPLMQYTGLKDKNGVEIYEGDIIRFRNYTPTTVVFSERHAGFRTNRPPETGMLEISAPYSYLVIGNIHQNPELLESDK